MTDFFLMSIKGSVQPDGPPCTFLYQYVCGEQIAVAVLSSLVP